MAKPSELWIEWLGSNNLDNALDDGTTPQEWINKNFSPIDREHWLAAGEWDPVSCDELANAQIFPGELIALDLASSPGKGYHAGDYSNGNLDISDIEDLLC